MGHYARINDNNIVEEVIVAKKEFIDSGLKGDPTKWIKTSYNTHGGEHYDRNNRALPDGLPGLRKNYAGLGYTYDKDRDAFIAPKPYPSWILDEDTCAWNSPVSYPTDGKLYDWDEDSTSWKEIE